MSEKRERERESIVICVCLFFLHRFRFFEQHSKEGGKKSVDLEDVQCEKAYAKES